MIAQSSKKLTHLTLGNIFEYGNVLCEICQKPIKEYVDELILDFDMLNHKKCWETKK